MTSGRAFVENARQKRTDKRCEFFFGGSIWFRAAVRRKFLESVFLCASQNFEIKIFFVTEMIIDGGDVRVGALTNFTDRCIAKTNFRKNFGGRFEKILTRL